MVEVGSSPISGLAVQLAPGAELTGHLKVEGTGVDPKSMRVILQPRSTQLMRMGTPGGMIKDDNTFTLSNVVSEHYDLRAIGIPQGSYLKSIKLGDSDVTDSGLDFTSGPPGGELTVVVSTAGAQVDGSVQNDKQEPATGVTVVLIPANKAERLLKQTSVDQNGNFSVKGVAPGDYRVYAFDYLEPGSAQDPDWLKPFESKGTKISVQENGHESLQLKLVLTQVQ